MASNGGNEFRIPETMKAWVLGDPDQLSMVEKPVPDPGRAEVLVRIDAIAVCATDLEILSHGLPAMIDGELPAPPMAETLAFILTEAGDGFVAFEGETAAKLLNPMGAVHGGWALTLIDSATTCAALSVLPPGVGCTTVETKANFARPIFADSGRVRAEGRVVTQGRRLLTAEAKVTDARGRVLAHGTSTLMTVGADR